MNEALRASRLGDSREGEHLLDLHLPPRALGPGSAQRAAETAERGMAGKAFELRFEPVERHDPVREPRVLAAERPARDGIHPREIGSIEPRRKQMPADETARASEQCSFHG